MIHFNIDHLLPFQGYSVNGVRQSFISLSHFLACEKHYTFNSDYYLHLCTLQSLDDIFTETSQYSNDLINSHFAKHRNRIILTGLHFSINQNKDYFFGFDTFEEDVYSEDPDLNDLINNYRKRYMIATNTDRLFLYSDDDWSEKQESLTEYIVNLLTDSPPEEVIIEDGTRFTLHAMEVAHEMYLPTTLIKSRTDLPLGQNIRSLEFHNSSLSKEKADNPALDSPGVFL